MNAAFRIGDTELMADDGMGEKQPEFKGMSLVIDVADDAEAKRVLPFLRRIPMRKATAGAAHQMRVASDLAGALNSSLRCNHMAIHTASR